MFWVKRVLKDVLFWVHESAHFAVRNRWWGLFSKRGHLLFIRISTISSRPTVPGGGRFTVGWVVAAVTLLVQPDGSVEARLRASGPAVGEPLPRGPACTAAKWKARGGGGGGGATRAACADPSLPGALPRGLRRPWQETTARRAGPQWLRVAGEDTAADSFSRLRPVLRIWICIGQLRSCFDCGAQVQLVWFLHFFKFQKRAGCRKTSLQNDLKANWSPDLSCHRNF